MGRAVTLLYLLGTALAVDRLYDRRPSGSPVPLGNTKTISYETCTAICHATEGCLSLTWSRINSDCILYDIALDSSASVSLPNTIWVNASWDNRCDQKCRKFDTPECFNVHVLDITSTSLVVHWQFQTDDPNVRPYFNYDRLTSIVQNPAAEGHEGSYPAITETDDLATLEVRELALSDLVPGMRYDVTIQMKEGSDVNFECETAVVSTIPIRPVLSGAASGNQVTVTWTQEGVVSKYEAWNSPADGICGASRCTIDMLGDPSRDSFTFTGLVTGKAYRFFFVAFGLVESSESPRSNVRVIVPPSVPTVTGKEADTNAINLTWTQPGVAKIYYFWVTPNEGICSQEPEGKCKVTDDALREFQITGLIPGKKYQVFMEAESNGLLSGHWSEFAITPPSMPTFRTEATCYKIRVFVDNPEGHTHKIRLQKQGDTIHELNPGDSVEYIGYDPSENGKQSDIFTATSVLEPALDSIESERNEQELFSDVTNKMRACITTGTHGTTHPISFMVKSDSSIESTDTTDVAGGYDSSDGSAEACEWNTFDFLLDENGDIRNTGAHSTQCFVKTCQMCEEYPRKVVFTATNEPQWCLDRVEVSTWSSYDDTEFRSLNADCGGGCLNTANTDQLKLICS